MTREPERCEPVHAGAPDGQQDAAGPTQLQVVLKADRQVIGTLRALRPDAGETFEAVVEFTDFRWAGNVPCVVGESAFALARKILETAELAREEVGADHCEEWRRVHGYEGMYEVSDHGRVRSVPRGTSRGGIMRGYIDQKGYRRISLCGKDGSRNVLVHRMVATAFLGEGLAEQLVCHGDDNPANNRLSNLRWGSRSDNAQDALRNGRLNWSQKPECKRGHALMEPNLRVAELNRGKRKCLACHRAIGKVRRSGGDVQELSDWHYLRIMQPVDGV